MTCLRPPPERVKEVIFAFPFNWLITERPINAENGSEPARVPLERSLAGLLAGGPGCGTTTPVEIYFN